MKIGSGRAVTTMMREANAEPIPGYRLIEPLGSGGFGEVWKCEAPGGWTSNFLDPDGHMLSFYQSNKSPRKLG